MGGLVVKKVGMQDFGRFSVTADLLGVSAWTE